MNITGPVVGITGAFLATSAVERYLPVVTWMQADGVSIEGGAVEARVSGYKILDCAFVAGSQIAWAKTETGWRELGPLIFVDDPTPNSTRPASDEKQDFGIWRWEDVPAGADEIKVTVMNNCDGRIRVTTVGPFDIGVSG